MASLMVFFSFFPILSVTIATSAKLICYFRFHNTWQATNFPQYSTVHALLKHTWHIPLLCAIQNIHWNANTPQNVDTSMAHRTHVRTRKISNLKLLHAGENCSFVGFAKRSDDNKKTKKMACTSPVKHLLCGQNEEVKVHTIICLDLLCWTI